MKNLFKNRNLFKRLPLTIQCSHKEENIRIDSVTYNWVIKVVNRKKFQSYKSEILENHKDITRIFNTKI